MKIYDYQYHHSFDIDIKDIDVGKTKNRGHGYTRPDSYEDFGGHRWRGYTVFLLKDSKHFMKFPGFYVSKKTWEKVCTFKS